MNEIKSFKSSSPSEKKEASKNKSSFPLLIKSLLATGAFVGIVVIGMTVFGNFNFSIFPRQTDELTESQRQERLDAFNALGTIRLAIVPEKERTKAIESMELSSQAKESLQLDLSKTSGNASQRAVNHPAVLPPASLRLDEQQSSTKATSSNPEQVAKDPAPANAKQMQLAWITLWDSDVEDGDMVRIDSEGYSRTVYLRKKPLTFAVPVPANGIIYITGVRDGDGGGITVGLGSGDVKAILPIMSVGQVLPLKIGVN
jgi:hypothetical protein